MTHPVTIVVPVYGDLESLTTCVSSLIANVDQSVHRVLLVNDSGPEADAIETALRRQIDGQPAFRYERNPSNLGFVGNCNRAVLELDDTDNDILLLNSDTLTTPGFVEVLSTVLHSSDENGAVCPRSNNATVASLPFALRDPSVGRPMERTAAVHAALAPLLPSHTYSPVAMGFCILIKRELIRRFGLFDETFAPGYGEENDFCLRIGRHGYRSMIAHGAVVYHLGGRSFQGARREALRSAHEKIIVSRYPEYTEAVQRYIYIDRDPVDVFADALVPGDEVARVLIPVVGDGHGHATADETALLRAAGRWSGPVRVTAVAPAAMLRGLARAHPSLAWRRDDHVSGVWDLALLPGTEPDARRRALLNRTCLRWAAVGTTAVEHLTARFDEAPDEAAVVLLSRCDVDLEALRRRWALETSRPDYLADAGSPREPLMRRALRRAERIAPRPVGWSKAVVRQILGRTG
ncbi:glycosyltransferase family 2 protein [Leifsonia poae]|uniref:Glycosyltransferase 2-like domain-containing protein n=1 Tax=Leifsonia poae TaxID=110933 RepID=A0A9W6LYV4_9MICO|nr:glycosyltransferase family 2 protein [Leifsonia poae]GLJ74969.1 hypothetical protein GCM10017584_05420 [Leifsonia poae]